LGAALVALLFLSGELGVQASAVTESRPGEGPLILGVLGLQLGVTSESRAGEAPILAGDTPQAFVAEILTPLVGLELHRPNFTFELFYGPRIYWEDPNPSATQTFVRDPLTRINGKGPIQALSSGPLILHSAGLTLNARPTRGLSVLMSATGSIGSPDYTALPQVLGTVQGALPPIARIESGTAQAKLGYKVAPRWQLDLGATVYYWHWLDLPPGSFGLATGTVPTSVVGLSSTNGQASVAEQPFVTGQTTVSATPGATFALTARDGLGFGTDVAATSYSDGVSILLVTPAVTWKRRLTRLDDLRLTLGFTYGRALAAPLGSLAPFGTAGSAASPVGSFELDLHLMRREEVTVLATVNTGVEYYFDPILGTAVPRAIIGAGLTAISIPAWVITLRGDFGTAIRTSPYSFVETGVAPSLPASLSSYPDETAFSLTLSDRRRISENFYAEIGGRWADRGPALVTPDFHFHQRQLWVFLALTATTHPIPRPAQQR
jgi:hypothetical protein